MLLLHSVAVQDGQEDEPFSKVLTVDITQDSLSFFNGSHRVEDGGGDLAGTLYNV